MEKFYLKEIQKAQLALNEKQSITCFSYFKKLKFYY